MLSTGKQITNKNGLDVCYEDGDIILVEDIAEGVRGCVNIERDPESHRMVQGLWSRLRYQFICEKKQRGFVIRMFISQRKVWPPDKFGNIKYYSAPSAKYLETFLTSKGGQ